MSKLDFENIKRVVIKVGTSTLTRENGELNLERIANLAWVLSDLRNREIDVVLVSSGAIGIGTKRLGLSTRPRDVKGKQATSAVGQAVLMQIYQNFFMEYNQVVAQVLLTKDIFDNDERYQNAKNTFLTLFDLGVIPIVNENDTVSVDELGFSDNDNLSAYVSCLAESDLLIILSDIDGLFDSDPNINDDAKIINEVNRIDENLHNIASGSHNKFGTGGMSSKICAVERAWEKNIPVIIASGKSPNIIFEILKGESIGTLFLKRDCE